MRNRRLYVLTAFDKLELNELYTIHIGDDSFYYTAMFRGMYLYDDDGLTAQFRYLMKHFKNPDQEELGLHRSFFTAPRHFGPDKIFKRIVEYDEEKAAYRAAFEKRAVNQIVGSIIGHAGNFY